MAVSSLSVTSHVAPLAEAELDGAGDGETAGEGDADAAGEGDTGGAGDADGDPSPGPQAATTTKSAPASAARVRAPGDQVKPPIALTPLMSDPTGIARRG
jgi:hypothetical protein